MWITLITLGLVVLLAWKAPRAFKVLLIVVGSLVLLGALAGGGWWLVHNRTQAGLAAKFDADPDGASIPPELFVYNHHETYGTRWAVFNVSPDTAYRCHGRRAVFNSAGVKLSADESREWTFEPLQREDTESADNGSRFQLTGCVGDVRGKATVNAVRALVLAPNFEDLPLRVRLSALRKVVAAEPGEKPPEAMSLSDSGSVLFEDGDNAGEQLVKSLMATYIEQALKKARRTSEGRIVEVDNSQLLFPAEMEDAQITKAVWKWLNGGAPGSE